jgi:hypothetical protein
VTRYAGIEPDARDLTTDSALFDLAEAAGDPAVARDSVHHFKRYSLLMFEGDET